MTLPRDLADRLVAKMDRQAIESCSRYGLPDVERADLQHDHRDLADAIEDHVIETCIELEQLASTGLSTCACCGFVHSNESWEGLELVGSMDDGAGGGLELRNCQCGSTITRPIRPSSPRSQSPGP